MSCALLSSKWQSDIFVHKCRSLLIKLVDVKAYSAPQKFPNHAANSNKIVVIT